MEYLREGNSREKLGMFELKIRARENGDNENDS